jgi:hypothetical protein
MTGSVARIATWLGSALLAATAAFHASGLPDIRTAAAAARYEGMLGMAIEPLWLFPSLHWAVLALIALALPGGRSASLALLLIGLLLVADAALLFFYLGPFVGEAMLAGAGSCFVAAALLRRKTSA